MRSGPGDMPWYPSQRFDTIAQNQRTRLTGRVLIGPDRVDLRVLPRAFGATRHVPFIRLLFRVHLIRATHHAT